MKKNFLLALICTAFATLPITSDIYAQEVVFSNDFEDGDLIPEVGTATLVVDTAAISVVPVVEGGDATLGDNVALYDLNVGTLDLTLNLTETLSLVDGNVVSLDFDVAARRTNGIAKVLFVDALDRSGNIVTRFVLGDNNAFGNAGGDRQRPGYETLADGRLVFGSPPASFWWGADTTPDEFDFNRDAHVSLRIGETSFSVTTTSQTGVEFTATDLSNYDAVTSTNIAEVKITSLREAGFGMYFDNIVVEGVIADDVPFVLGDCNVNGEVDFDDISPFITFLTTGDLFPQADTSQDGRVDFDDIAPFIAILSSN